MLSGQAMYTILIVDDNPQNLFTLRALLERELDARIVEAISGVDALEKICHDRFDLILLDIKMPDMDGFETARLIRNRKKYKDIPIIFLTAVYKSEEFKWRGLEGGAIDYLTKPLDDTILIHRVKAYLRVIYEERTMNMTLERMNEQLQREIAQRTEAENRLQSLNAELELRVKERTLELQQSNKALEESLENLRMAQEHLVQSEKMAALGGLVAGVSHEISTPLGIGVTASSNLEEQSRELKRAFEAGTMTKSDFIRYLDLTIESSEIILRNLQRASEQIKGFKQIAVDQASEEKRRFLFKEYLEEILLSLHPKLKKTRHHVEIHCPDELVLESYPGAFSQIVTNFVMNSLIHAFDENDKGIMTLDISTTETHLQIMYSDDGKGISPEDQKRIFEPFFTTKRDQGGSGLGLNIIHNLVTHRLKGTIACSSVVGEGTAFTIQIPWNVVHKSSAAGNTK